MGALVGGGAMRASPFLPRLKGAVMPACVAVPDSS